MFLYKHEHIGRFSNLHQCTFKVCGYKKLFFHGFKNIRWICLISVAVAKIVGQLDSIVHMFYYILGEAAVNEVFYSRLRLHFQSFVTKLIRMKNQRNQYKIMENAKRSILKQVYLFY